MDTAQRIKLIRMIEKIEKNPEFSSKIGVRNTSEFISSKQSKKMNDSNHNRSQKE